jgi:hypothetical protein
MRRISKKWFAFNRIYAVINECIWGTNENSHRGVYQNGSGYNQETYFRNVLSKEELVALTCRCRMRVTKLRKAVNTVG